MNFDRIILVNLLWLLPVAFWPGSTSYDGLKFTLLAFAAAAWLGHGAWREGRESTGLPLNPLGFGLWLGLLIVLGLGLFRAANPTLVIRTALLISLFALVVWQTARQAGEPREMNSLLMAITMSSTAAAVYGLLQMKGMLPGAAPNSGYPPGISTLGNQNYLAGLVGVSVWPTLVLALRARNSFARAFSLTALVLLLTTLIMAGATGPQVGVAVASLLVLPGLILIHRQRATWVPPLLGALILGCGVAGGAFVWQTIHHPDLGGESLSGKLLAANHGDIRRTDWLTAAAMIRQYPLTGVGAGNYLVRWPEFRSRLNETEPHSGLAQGAPVSTRAHNEELQWIAETGLAGLLWLMVALGLALTRWQRRFFSLTLPGQRDHLLLTAGLLTVAVHSLVSFPLHLPATALVVACLLGLVLPPCRPPHQSQGNPLARTQALALIMAALALVVGSFREFRGDLELAAGRQFFIRGEAKPAVAHLQQGVHGMRWPGHGYLFLGLARTALGQDEAATGDFEISLLDHPTFEAHLALAEAAINRQEFPVARHHLQVVQNCRPDQSFRRQAAFLAGLLQLRQGHFDQARLEFQGLLREDPSQQRALLALGYLETVLDHPQEARQYYQRALKVIDEKIARFKTDPGQQSRAYLVRLEQNRQVAVKALAGQDDGRP